MYKVWGFLSEYSLLLVIGAALALIWANVDPHGYHAVTEINLWENSFVGHLHTGADGHASRSLTLHYLVNDIGMAFFFAIAGKEVWEAVALRSGSLRGARALTPLVATVGGMVGPAVVYLAGALLAGKFVALSSGWAIPTATDIAFSYLVGRIVFGAGHPAVRFLLLLAIADDAGGLLILAVFYPTGTLAPFWLLVSMVAAVGVYLLANRIPRMLDGTDPARPWATWTHAKLGFWPYLIAAVVSWFAFQEAGIHPALGLLPIVPTIPHADVDFGFFAAEEAERDDLLNEMEHALKPPIQGVLFLFGLFNAGVEFSTISEPTWLVLCALLIGKPLGITLMGWLAARKLGLGMPEGMAERDLFVLGCVAAIGFTVSLFVAGVAFAPGPVQDAAKMGALLSFFAAPIAVVAGLAMGVKKRHV